ncbi:MAG TPA: SDR family oxidoreductase [Verrucomicrobiae bacterium]|nr:SDR family oxidoreductase [Verrucomicrobiae bacterium]
MRWSEVFPFRRGRHSLNGKIVLITGGSRGLGLELARCFAQEHARVVLLARDLDELTRAAEGLQQSGTEVSTVRCDVTDRTDVECAIDAIFQKYGAVDVLVNNAGAIQVGPLSEMTREDFEAAMDVHFRGPFNLISAVVPLMRQQGGGRITNIVSIGGKIAVPHMAPYSASKFALAGLSDAIRNELGQHHIYVTTVFPGLMRTGSIYQARFKGQQRAEFSWFSVCGSMPILSMHSTRAARKIVRACRRGSPQLIVGVPAKAAVLLHALFPGLSAYISATVARRLPSSSATADTSSRAGQEFRATAQPLFFIQFSDKAALRNNELS